jgi:hypothetical protein
MRELPIDPILKARAEALFREAAKQVRTDAVSDYRAKKATELEKMARLRAMRTANVCCCRL